MLRRKPIFSADRMAREYESAYRELISAASRRQG
jgi:hypothetical protein